MTKFALRELKYIETLVAIAALILFAFGFFWLSVKYLEEKNQNQELEARINILSDTLLATRGNLEVANKENSDLQNTNQNLAGNLQSEKSKNELFQSQINSISGTVGDLQKLSNTDKELLMLYSKVYFLNENYVPSNLTQISSQYLQDTSKNQEFHTKAYPFLSRMIDAAKGDGVDLKIVSAYRSFDEQAAVKSGYKVVYGSGANKFSADQGYSEHQLGTTIDFTTPKLASLVLSFETTKAYEWLQNNAYKYGFILSYPKNNSYYMFEPWHWRFVGVALAGQLHSVNLNFYDMSQRDANSYLLHIFD